MPHNTLVILLGAVVLPLTLVTSNYQKIINEPTCDGQNEQYYQPCKPCPEYCNGKPICPKNCESGCYCSPGFVMESAVNKKCIAKDKCIKCGRLEVFDPCGAGCEDTCEKKAEICTLACVPGCKCKKGYVRHNKRCILPSRCPKKEEYY